MAHGVTLKAVRDELAALGHDLSEGAVASLLADADVSGLLHQDPGDIDETGESDVAELTARTETDVSANERESDAEAPVADFGWNPAGKDFYEVHDHGKEQPDRDNLGSEDRPISMHDWPAGLEKLSELWENICSGRSSGESLIQAVPRPYTARPRTAKQPSGREIEELMGLDDYSRSLRPRSAMTWARSKPTLTRSYNVPALAPPRKGYIIDRVNRYRQMQQIWDTDPFLKAGGGGALGRRKVANYREAFAACHADEELARQTYLQQRRHRELPLSEPPTLKRRDSLMRSRKTTPSLGVQDYLNPDTLSFKSSPPATNQAV